MAIIPSEPNHDDSPWYMLMEEKAVAWNNFLKSHNFSIEGNYNAYFVWFTAIDTSRKIRINGRRDLKNVSTFIPRDSIFIESIEIDIENSNIESQYFLKYKKSWIKNFFGAKNGIYRKWRTSNNEESALFQLKILNLLDNVNLHRLEINKKGISLRIAELPTDTSSISYFLNYCSKINTFTSLPSA